MVGARSLAMALNRLIDARHRRREPAHRVARDPVRRARRSGPWSRSASPSLVVFLVAVWQLDPLVRWLWPIPVLAFVVYPYLKRFTWLCHLWLGAVDGLAPVGAWAAIKGHAAVGGVGARRRRRSVGGGLRPLLRAVRRRGRPRQGLHSWATASASAARSRARARCTSLTVGAARRRRHRPARRPALLARSVAVAALLGYEHSLVRPGDLRRLDAAFFTMNGVISVAFFAFVLVDVVCDRRSRCTRARWERRRCALVGTATT